MHAQARDAVHAALDVPALKTELAPLNLPVVTVQSAAPNRQAYFARPDWRRRLHPDTQLAPLDDPPDLLFVLSDGLSVTAVERNTVAQRFTAQLQSNIRPDGLNYELAARCSGAALAQPSVCLR